MLELAENKLPLRRFFLLVKVSHVSCYLSVVCAWDCNVCVGEGDLSGVFADSKRIQFVLP